MKINQIESNEIRNMKSLEAFVKMPIYLSLSLLNFLLFQSILITIELQSALIIKFASRVESTAVSANVAIGSGLDTDTTQLGHGSNEGSVEGLSTMSPNLDSGSRPCVTEEHLVGSEEAHSLLQILEVHIVEPCGCVWVHVYGYPWIHVSWAHLLKPACVGWVQRWIHWICTAEIVYSVCQFAAVGESDRVRSCIVVTFG